MLEFIKNFRKILSITNTSLKYFYEENIPTETVIWKYESNTYTIFKLDDFYLSKNNDKFLENVSMDTVIEYLEEQLTIDDYNKLSYK